MAGESAAIKARYKERQKMLKDAQECLDDCEIRLDAVQGFYFDPDYRAPSKLMTFGKPKLVEIEADIRKNL